MARKYRLTQDGPEVQALLNKIDGLKANQTPGQGATPTALETLALEGVLYSVVTKAVSDLVNYYTKSETYTKAEVGQMLSALSNGAFVPVPVLPEPSAETFGMKIYLVPTPDPKVQNIKDEFITVRSGEEGSYIYAWEQIGSTAVDLSGYVTTEALNTALANYVTSDALATALAGLSDVKYTSQSLTDAQKLQARTNIGATAPEIFWAEYGVTTLSEITTAYNSGKAVLCLRQGSLYVISKLEASFCYFTCINRTSSQYLLLNGQTSWSAGLSSLQTTGNLSQSVPTDRESTTKYPSVKAVFDSIGKWGVISQTQTWTGSAATGYDYTMSNLVYGLIPQANIDLYVSAGAVFNETTGYFELNGLTDISYNEMNRIYVTANLDNGAKNVSGYLQGNTSRTNISTWIGTWNQKLLCTQIAMVSHLESFEYSTPGNSHYTHANCNWMFQQSNYLKRIGELVMSDTTSATDAFSSLPSLESVTIKGLKISLLFKQSSRLNLASVVYMVDNAANTTAITITLHPTAFARCQADTTEYTYNEQTYTGIIALATAKNITIVSA